MFLLGVFAGVCGGDLLIADRRRDAAATAGRGALLAPVAGRDFPYRRR
jgi:hypothetical protein